MACLPVVVWQLVVCVVVVLGVARAMILFLQPRRLTLSAPELSLLDCSF
jgi:hypothetical protein